MTPRATESDILAWVEGESLPADRAAALRAAFESDADLRVWAERMRADRGALSRWGDRAADSAPRGLAEAAIACVEREALLGAAPVEIEKARREAEREKRPAVVFRMRWVAAAAAVLVVGGVSIVALLERGGGRGDGTATELLAGATPPVGLSEPAERASAESIERALADAKAPVAGAGAGASADDAANALAQDALASAAPARRERRANMNEMAELARQRRLIVRARAENPREVLERAVALSAGEGEAIAFTLDGAGDGGSGAEAGASVAARENALTRLVGLLEEAGASGVELVAAEEAGFAASGNPADVFWWTEPVDRWATLVRVPIVITGERPGESVVR